MYHEKVSIPAKYRYFADSADFGPKIASDCAQTRLRAQKMTILREFSENREENRGGCREKRKGKQTGCERQTCESPRREGPPRSGGEETVRGTGGSER